MTNPIKMSGYAEWNSSTAYATNDAVVYNGVLYIALQNSLNRIPPANPTYWASSGGGSGVASLNGLTGALTIGSLTPNLTVSTAPGAVQLAYVPLPTPLVHSDVLTFGPGTAVLTGTPYTPTTTGNYLINYQTVIASATGGTISMNSAAGDRVITVFSQVSGFGTLSNLATYSIPSIPATAGVVSVENESTAVQTLTAGTAYQMTVELFNPSGTSTWSATNSGARVFVYGPF